MEENKKQNEKIKKDNKKTLVGVVVSTKPEKSAVISVEKYTPHPKYKKYVRTHKKYTIHDPENSCVEGDKVQVKECRKYSKTKSFEFLKKFNK